MTNINTIQLTGTTINKLAKAVQHYDHNKKPLILFGQDLEVTVLQECAKKVIKQAKTDSKLLTEVDEMYSRLSQKVWIELDKKGSDFHTIAFIRRLIGFRIVDCIRKKAQRDCESLFITYESENEEGDVLGFEDVHVPSTPSLEREVSARSTIDFLRSHLNTKQNQFLDLVSEGFSNSEICQIMNVSINTPTNLMKQIKKVATELNIKPF